MNLVMLILAILLIGIYFLTVVFFPATELPPQGNTYMCYYTNGRRFFDGAYNALSLALTILVVINYLL